MERCRAVETMCSFLVRLFSLFGAYTCIFHQLLWNKGLVSEKAEVAPRPQTRRRKRQNICELAEAASGEKTRGENITEKQKEEKSKKDGPHATANSSPEMLSRISHACWTRAVKIAER